MIEPAVCPFTVLVDTAEQQPWTFQGLQADAKDDYRPLVVNYRFSDLGRFPHSRGDYTIEGYESLVGVERKSMEDVWATVLGWETEFNRERGTHGRRDRFHQELRNLARMQSSCVIVEANRSDCLEFMPSWGDKSVETNRKIFNRSILSFIESYGVPWLFSDGRRMAEVDCFRFLEIFWRHEQEREAGKRKPKEERCAVQSAMPSCGIFALDSESLSLL